MTAINQALSVLVYVFRGAAKPFVFGRDAANVNVPFDTTLKCVITPRDTAVFTLTVGNGITLSNIGAVANAKARVQLDYNQSLAVVVGDFTQFKILEGTNPNERVIYHGRMIGEE